MSVRWTVLPEASAHRLFAGCSIEETAAAAGEDEIKTQSAGIRVESFTRRKATRRNFPDHLPRRRVFAPLCAGS